NARTEESVAITDDVLPGRPRPCWSAYTARRVAANWLRLCRDPRTPCLAGSDRSTSSCTVRFGRILRNCPCACAAWFALRRCDLGCGNNVDGRDRAGPRIID